MSIAPVMPSSHLILWDASKSGFLKVISPPNEKPQSPSYRFSNSLSSEFQKYLGTNLLYTTVHTNVYRRA